jgi:hypothetical protein
MKLDLVHGQVAGLVDGGKVPPQLVDLVLLQEVRGENVIVRLARPLRIANGAEIDQFHGCFPLRRRIAQSSG